VRKKKWNILFRAACALRAYAPRTFNLKRCIGRSIRKNRLDCIFFFFFFINCFSFRVVRLVQNRASRTFLTSVGNNDGIQIHIHRNYVVFACIQCFESHFVLVLLELISNYFRSLAYLMKGAVLLLSIPKQYR